MKRFIIPIAALALSLPAFAQAEDGQMRVKVGDLNLDSSAGAATALGRIRIASGRFCGASGADVIIRHQAIVQCRTTMMAKAVAQLDAPRVTALYQPASPMAVAKR